MSEMVVTYIGNTVLRSFHHASSMRLRASELVLEFWGVVILCNMHISLPIHPSIHPSIIHTLCVTTPLLLLLWVADCGSHIK